MFQALKKMFAAGEEAVPPAVPEGQRVYAIGDIHGRLDLFAALVNAIEADDAEARPAETTVILLGDLVDRGPDSAGVLQLARDWQKRRTVRILAGNHEEMFLRSLDDIQLFRHFLRHGGKETVLSFGVGRTQFTNATMEEAQALMLGAVNADDREFIESFEDMITVGDYLFVHAGIEPGVPLEEQKRAQLRWIREPFLSHTGSHGPVVVHGHTITGEPEDHGNRIGIDTGAFMSGRLTALVLEGTVRRYLVATADEAGAINASAYVA